MVNLKILKNQIYNVSQCSEKIIIIIMSHELVHKVLHLKIKIKPISIHPTIVKIILFFLNVSMRIDTVFDNQKLLDTGFKTKLNFEQELKKFLKNVI